MRLTEQSLNIQQVIESLEIGDEYFWEPLRLTRPGAWTGHLTTAFWLTKVVKPRTFVELGTHSGNSYSAFCQAISRLGLPTRAFAIDTWRGDEHSGFYDDSVFDDLNAFNQSHFPTFSRLLRTSFDEARAYFAKGSINLLHVDGLHRYEVVRHDFETWKDAMSSNGVVVFHETNVREREFGVWKLWTELAQDYPSFEFYHSGGLGILGLGESQSPLLSRLFEFGRQSESCALVQRFFAARGETFTSRVGALDLENRITGLLGDLTQESRRVSDVEQKFTDLNQTLAARDEQIVALSQTATARSSEIESLTQELANTRQALGDRESDGERLRKELISVTTRIESEHWRQDRLTAQVAAMKNEIETRRVEAEELHKQIERQRLSLITADGRLKLLHASGSWRLTAPIRELKARMPWLTKQFRRVTIVSGWIFHFQLRSGLRAAKLLRQNATLLQEAAGLFDRQWYLEVNPDVAATGIDPLVHYLRQGAAEGRDPNPYFDSDWYLQQYPDVAHAGLNPLGHYHRWGTAQGKDPSLLFDTDWYLSQNPDVASSGINPLQHFLQYGLAEHRPPRSSRSDGSVVDGCKETIVFREGLRLRESPRIAVMLHVFYADLLQEMLDATLTIPFAFDLLLSTPSPDIADEAKKWAAHRRNVQLTTEVVPNRGRDIAPLLVTFGPRLLTYDAFCHIHSKKSLYSGEDQRTWRHHLISNLLGSREKVEYILHLLLERELGLVYPKTYYRISYTAHTWLSSREAGTVLLQKLGLSDEPSCYLDFPAGTMFWARPHALRELLDGRFSFEDFPEESGQNDGTLAHAVERTFVPVAKSNGASFAEIDFDSQVLRVNLGSKNLEQYAAKNLVELKQWIDQSEVVSFDIFDTLITRPLMRPDHLFTLVERRLDRELKRSTNFARSRREAEIVARQRSPHRDVAINEIYRELAAFPLFDQELAAAAFALELKLEYELVIPRKPMIEAYDYCVAMGKRVLLVSDMYLTGATIEPLLTKAGISGWSELYVSSEVGLRKDTGQLWDWLIRKENLERLRWLHIGDNEQSDSQMPGDRKACRLYHVMSPINLFALSKWGRSVAEQLGTNWKAADYLGPVVAILYNDPFREVSFD